MPGVAVELQDGATRGQSSDPQVPHDPVRRGEPEEPVPFADVQVHVQAWDDQRNQPLSIYRRRGRFENQEAWLAYIVGMR